VTAGGTAVGGTLLSRALEAFPYAAKQLPELRMIVVAGPRLDPAALAAPAGVEVLGYLPDLDQHLAACNIAVVQGGLTTAMELTANRRPFLYFPLANHFEQQRHVAYRLDRYRAPDGECSSPTSDPRTSPTLSSPSWLDRSTTRPWRPTARDAPPR
jgi:predicted glycosyltransferase